WEKEPEQEEYAVHVAPVGPVEPVELRPLLSAEPESDLL
ncbi:hypothetical protein T265_12410, partial [Opisthorchis viverrini]